MTGVLLLNAVLTVRAHQANSHKDHGWEQFTDAVIAWLNKRTAGTVFILWGSYAQKKGACIDKASVQDCLSNFFTVRSSYTSTVLGIVILTVRLSVCLSVTRVLCDETIEHTADILIPHERVIILVFRYQRRLVGDCCYLC